MGAPSDPGSAGLNFTVRDNDSVDSIAYAFGHCREALWDHPRNVAIKEQRKDGRVLSDGDVIYIPPREPAAFMPNATSRRHRFQVRNAPSLLRFRPYALAGQGLATHFDIILAGSVVASADADADGDVVWPLAPDAEDITVRAYFDGFYRDYAMRLRALDPVTTLRGVQQRLHGLGFYGGDCNGEQEGDMLGAIATFKMHHGMHSEEGLSDRVRDALHRVFGESKQ